MKMTMIFESQPGREVFHFRKATDADTVTLAQWCDDNLDPEGCWRIMSPVMNFGNRFGRTGQVMGQPGYGDLLVLLSDPGDAALLRLHWAQLTREAFR